MKPAQHALPHDTTYKLVRTFHTGGIENGVGCQNCGKVLSNVAEVINAEGRTYVVGLDCAATLATVNPFEFDAAQEAFNMGKKVRAALLKWRKKYEGTDFDVETYQSSTGDEVVVSGYRMRTWCGARVRDRLFSHYVPNEVYATIVQPLCGDMLPTTVRTMEEQIAADTARNEEFKRAYKPAA